MRNIVMTVFLLTLCESIQIRKLGTLKCRSAVQDFLFQNSTCYFMKDKPTLNANKEYDLKNILSQSLTDKTSEKDDNHIYTYKNQIYSHQSHKMYDTLDIKNDTRDETPQSQNYSARTASTIEIIPQLTTYMHKSISDEPIVPIQSNNNKSTTRPIISSQKNNIQNDTNHYLNETTKPHNKSMNVHFETDSTYNDLISSRDDSISYRSDSRSSQNELGNSNSELSTTSNDLEIAHYKNNNSYYNPSNQQLNTTLRTPTISSITDLPTTTTNTATTATLTTDTKTITIPTSTIAIVPKIIITTVPKNTIPTTPKITIIPTTTTHIIPIPVATITTTNQKMTTTSTTTTTVKTTRTASIDYGVNKTQNYPIDMLDKTEGSIQNSTTTNTNEVIPVAIADIPTLSIENYTNTTPINSVVIPVAIADIPKLSHINNIPNNSDYYLNLKIKSHHKSTNVHYETDSIYNYSTTAQYDSSTSHYDSSSSQDEWNPANDLGSVYYKLGSNNYETDLSGQHDPSLTNTIITSITNKPKMSTSSPTPLKITTIPTAITTAKTNHEILSTQSYPVNVVNAVKTTHSESSSIENYNNITSINNVVIPVAIADIPTLSHNNNIPNDSDYYLNLKMKSHHKSTNVHNETDNIYNDSSSSPDELNSEWSPVNDSGSVYKLRSDNYEADMSSHYDPSLITTITTRITNKPTISTSNPIITPKTTTIPTTITTSKTNHEMLSYPINVLKTAKTTQSRSSSIQNYTNTTPINNDVIPVDIADIPISRHTDSNQNDSNYHLNLKIKSHYKSTNVHYETDSIYNDSTTSQYDSSPSQYDSSSSPDELNGEWSPVNDSGSVHYKLGSDNYEADLSRPSQYGPSLITTIITSITNKQIIRTSNPITTPTTTTIPTTISINQETLSYPIEVLDPAKTTQSGSSSIKNFTNITPINNEVIPVAVTDIPILSRTNNIPNDPDYYLNLMIKSHYKSTNVTDSIENDSSTSRYDSSSSQDELSSANDSGSAYSKLRSDNYETDLSSEYNPSLITTITTNITSQPTISTSNPTTPKTTTIPTTNTSHRTYHEILSTQSYPINVLNTTKTTHSESNSIQNDTNIPPINNEVIPVAGAYKQARDKPIISSQNNNTYYYLNEMTKPRHKLMDDHHETERRTTEIGKVSSYIPSTTEYTTYETKSINVNTQFSSVKDITYISSSITELATPKYGSSKDVDYEVASKYASDAHYTNDSSINSPISEDNKVLDAPQNFKKNLEGHSIDDSSNGTTSQLLFPVTTEDQIKSNVSTNAMTENFNRYPSYCNEDYVQNLNGIYYSPFGYMRSEFTQKRSYADACQYCHNICMDLIMSDQWENILEIKVQMMSQLQDEFEFWVSTFQTGNKFCSVNGNSGCPIKKYKEEKEELAYQNCSNPNHFICLYKKLIPKHIQCPTTIDISWRPKVSGLHKVSFGFVVFFMDYVNHWDAEKICRSKYCMTLYNQTADHYDEMAPLLKNYGTAEFWTLNTHPTLKKEDWLCDYIITVLNTIKLSHTLCLTKRPFICELRTV